MDLLVRVDALPLNLDFGRNLDNLSESEFTEEDLAREVGGEYNTLRVYLHLLKAKRSSPRDVQRALSFTSPTLAIHHLEKLSRFHLVDKQHDGTYEVRSKSFGILKLYIKSGKWILPRTVFFIAIFATMTTGFLLSTPESSYFWLASAISLAGLSFSIYETVRFYKALPRT